MGSRTTLQQLQVSQFDIRLDNFSFSETVLGYGAVISKNLFLVNQREFIELVTPYDKVNPLCLTSTKRFNFYGLLLATVMDFGTREH